jgi:hypothetical protein
MTNSPVDEPCSDEAPAFVRVTLDMDPAVLKRIEALRQQLGCRRRGTVINLLLRELFIEGEGDESLPSG